MSVEARLPAAMIALEATNATTYRIRFTIVLS